MPPAGISRTAANRPTRATRTRPRLACWLTPCANLSAKKWLAENRPQGRFGQVWPQGSQHCCYSPRAQRPGGDDRQPDGPSRDGFGVARHLGRRRGFCRTPGRSAASPSFSRSATKRRTHATSRPITPSAATRTCCFCCPTTSCVYSATRICMTAPASFSPSRLSAAASLTLPHCSGPSGFIAASPLATNQVQSFDPSQSQGNHLGHPHAAGTAQSRFSARCQAKPKLARLIGPQGVRARFAKGDQAGRATGQSQSQSLGKPRGGRQGRAKADAALGDAAYRSDFGQ